MKLTVLRIFGAALLFSAAACSSSDDGAPADPASSPIQATSTVALRTDVRHVDPAAWDALLVPHQGHGLWLKPEAKSSVALDVGAVTVIKGRGVLKVGAVRQDGDHLVVEQGALAFQDFIENGDIAIAGTTIFDTPFTDFASDLDVTTPEHTNETSTAPSTPAADGGLAPASFAVAPRAFSTGKEKSLFDAAGDFVLDGWHVDKQSASSGDDKLHYEITLTKTSGAFDAKIRLVGNVSGLGTKFNVSVHDHLTSQQTFDVKTSGDAELSWAVRISQGGTGYNKIIAPGATYHQQFFLGEIPMVLKIKTSVGIILGASGANTTTTGKVKLTYSSDSGVHVAGQNGGGEGTADSDLAFDGDQGTLATGPAAFGFVTVLPQVDLGVGIDELFVTGARFSNSISSVVTARGAVALSPCADITTKLTGKVGLFVDVTDSLAGQAISTGAALAKGLLSRTVYEKQRDDRTCGLHP